MFRIKNNWFLCDYMLQCNLFLWCKAEFSALLLQSSVSHDPSEIILICRFTAQETFLIIINVVLLNFLEIFCNIIHGFTVTSDQFIASLVNKSINFFKKKHLKLTKKWRNISLHLSYQSGIIWIQMWQILMSILHPGIFVIGKEEEEKHNLKLLDLHWPDWPLQRRGKLHWEAEVSVFTYHCHYSCSSWTLLHSLFDLKEICMYISGQIWWELSSRCLIMHCIRTELCRTCLTHGRN